LDRILSPEERDEGFVRHDLDELSLAEVIDDARSMSLFAGNRLIWIGGAESALPRGRAAAADEEPAAAAAATAALASYCEDPTPGTTLVFDARRWDFDGEDKPRLERLVKFYAPIRNVVEFARFSPQEAKTLAFTLAQENGMRMGTAEVEMLVEATAADAARIESEIQKLGLFARARGGKVTGEDIRALVPNSQETTIFALVNALARRDRAASLDLLDTLVRSGEYLPLALTFLGGIFRMALAAREQNLRSSSDVQSYFQRQGVPMWRSRAEQIHLAAAKFPSAKLADAVSLVFEADKGLKSARPDDRLVMEQFVLKLTA
jgi:DNA polymerase-3 subunit delta